MTVEQLVAEIVLQDTIEIEVLGKTLKVAQPSVATIIEASKIISSFPEMNITDETPVMQFTLANAHECDKLGELAAVLVLGKKHITRTKKRFFGLFKKQIDTKKELAERILVEYSPEQLQQLIVTILGKLNISFFFATIAFLSEINALKPTIKTPATASQPQSPQ